MKTLEFYAVGILTSWCLASGAFAETPQELLAAAQAAYLRGDIETAKRNFTLVNKADPRNQTAIGYLRMIAAKEAKTPTSSALQKQLDKVIVPKVDFREATFGSALEFLKQAAAKNSEGKVAVSFVVQVPEEQVKTQTVTLSLTNIPFTEVLRYLGNVANVEFGYEKYAIVVKPKTATSAAPAIAPQPGS